MNLAKKLWMTTGTSSGTVPTPSGGYVDDVFSAYTYTGNGSTQTINNGIDLAGEGGLVWNKYRNNAYNHFLIDTARGLGNGSLLFSNLTYGASNMPSPAHITSFNSDGYTLGGGTQNNSGFTYVSWTFRCAPKFFDVVTYTGDGVTGRQIAHSLGVQAGFITVKSTSATGDWNSYHRSATGDLKLNLDNTQTASRTIITAADANTFTVSGTANNNGVSYVAYLWAHDPSADGIIHCGSYPSGSPHISLGWEPQFVLCKSLFTDGSSWWMFDTSRGWANANTDNDYRLSADNSNSEIGPTDAGNPTSTGFVPTKVAPGDTFIYLAIRRQNKPPTSGTQVYNAIARTGTGVINTLIPNVGFSTDVAIFKDRSVVQEFFTQSRIVGAGGYLSLSPAGQEGATTGFVKEFGSTSVTVNANFAINGNGEPIINHFFRRAPGFMDVVCDTGTGAAHAITHNLTKAPELVIRKSRSAATQWEVWHSALAATEKLVLNSSAAKATDETAWNSTLPTATQFTVGTGANVNANTATFVTYLFATLAGVSKVGSYSGNGGTQTIPCGFTTGSRFVLIKRIDNTGDWFVWDTARGITPTTDPHLSLNTSAAEVTTDDSIDQATSGFIVNQNAATNINALGGNYLFLAIA